MRLNNFIGVYLSLLLLSTLLSCSSKVDDKVMAIQPYDQIDSNEVNLIKNGLQNIYGTKVVILESIPIPKSAFTSIKSPRYRADKLISYLKKDKPSSVDHVIGIINKDISTTKKDKNGRIKKPESKYSDWGIFGLGYRPGPSCIISTFRLKHKNNSVTKDRIRKISAHEIGHNLGLSHCKSGDNCLMKDAVESIRTIDNEKFQLCRSCKRKINLDEPTF